MKKSNLDIHLDKLYRRYLRKNKVVAFDVETTGLDPKTSSIFAYVLTFPSGISEVWRIDRDDAESKQGLERLKSLFSENKYAIIAHNYKFELSMLQSHSIYIHPDLVWHDTILMSRLLRNLSPTHSLDYFPWVLGGYTKKWDEIVDRQQKARGGRFDRVDPWIMKKYQIADGERTMLLFLTWIKEFTNKKELYKDYITEIELVKTTLKLEQFGMQLDWNESNKLIESLENKLHKLNHEIYAYLGEYINLNSDIQVRRIFFKKCKFPILKKTKTGKPAIDKDVIKELKDMGYKDPILNLTLKARTWTNALSMIRGYQERADEKGIIHPTINTCRAKTRRQSGENPNLQNVSKQEKLENPYAVPARACFRCRKGAVLFCVDYSGIEMRLIIDRADSKKMIEAMKRGEHPHVIASKLFYPDRFRSKEQDPTLYDCAKAGHFSLPYGATSLKLGKTLKFKNPLVEGREAFHRYAEEFPEIAFLGRVVAKEVKEKGYIETFTGHQAYVPISKAYVGLNALIQEVAAVILKRAEIMLDKYLEERWDGRIKMILTIHDELIFHYPRDLLKYKEVFIKEASYIMTDMPGINVPLEVEWKMSTSTWNRAKKVKI